MKKILSLAVMAAVVFIFAGCGATEDIKPGQGIMELEEGLSTVRYHGEDGFRQFLEQGGADSDAKVLEFLSKLSGGGETGLSMGGNPFGCSTISVKNTEGGYFFGRNFDWYGCEALVVEHDPEDGYASLSTVNLDFITGGSHLKLSEEMLTLAALYAPLDGMNEKGLCVSVNMIEDAATIDQDTGKPDLTTTTAIRLLLDQAADVDEALSLLKSYDLHASMGMMVHFAIADDKGNSVTAEYIDNKLVVTETPVLTNYYLAEGEKQGIGTEQSHIRFDRLKEQLEKTPSMTVEQVRDALETVSKHHFNDGETTEWSVVFDRNRLCAVYYHRENYGKGFVVKLEDGH